MLSKKTPNFEFIGSPKNMIHWTGIKVLTAFASVFVSREQKLEPPGKQQIYPPLFATLISCSENHSYAALISFLAILAKDVGLALLFTMHYWR